MLLISDDITIKNEKFKQAIAERDPEPILEIAKLADERGFSHLEIDVDGLGPDESDALLFIAQTLEAYPALKLVLRADDNATYLDVLPKIKQTGIIAPKKISEAEAVKIFTLINKLGDTWGVLFTQTYGKDTVSSEVEGMLELIRKAEQEGLMPELQYMEPLSRPLISEPNNFIRMKRMLDAFLNSYPDMNFYLYLPLVAEGLEDESILMNVFLGMANLIGVNAFCFSVYHEDHLKALRAAQAIQNDDVTVKEFVSK